ncbi:MAG TPA: ribosomal protein S18-alanine N-acetyltransferase [Acidimicrobiales bacterium]|nr:ribosomal protein S18-alanine N-acetyltransferase [Acidimicrobiales bacterium]
MATRPEPIEGLDVQLVPMRRRHLRTVLRIEATVYPRPWSLSLFMSELALRATRIYTVARAEGVVAGYAGLMLTGEDAHVTTIAVDPAFHRNKIATRLMLFMARAARDKGCRNLTLEVRVGNEAAKDLYRQFGFLPAGIRKGYYAETNEDALVMWAENIDTGDYEARLVDIEAGIVGTTSVEP